MADFDLNPDPRSTWGASSAYIEAWTAEFGSGGGMSAPEVEEPAESQDENLAAPTAFAGLGEALADKDL